jgi:hypothetical protein
MPVLVGQVQAPSNTSAVDGANLPLLTGKQSELIDSALHGQYYTAAYRGFLYQATTLVAGVVIPVQATNLVSTFTIWNPLGSGVNVELVRWSYANTTVTFVVSPIALWIQTAVGGANTVPGTLTTISSRNANWSSGAVNPIASSKATVYSAATLVNTMATNMWQGPILLGPAATSSTQIGPNNHDFNGSTLLGPGTLAAVAGFAAQTAASSQTLIWAEWPL